MDTLKCDVISRHHNNAVVLTVYRFKDIYNKIIPLFNKYDIKGIKALDL